MKKEHLVKLRSQLKRLKKDEIIQYALTEAQTASLCIDEIVFLKSRGLLDRIFDKQMPPK